MLQLLIVLLLMLCNGFFAMSEMAVLTSRKSRLKHLAEHSRRARKALSTCGWEAEGTPVLVTHEMIGRMLRAELRGLNATQALALRHPLGAVFDVTAHSERIL